MSGRAAALQGRNARLWGSACQSGAADRTVARPGLRGGGADHECEGNATAHSRGCLAFARLAEKTTDVNNDGLDRSYFDGPVIGAFLQVSIRVGAPTYNWEIMLPPAHAVSPAAPICMYDNPYRDPYGKTKQAKIQCPANMPAW